LVLGPKLRNHRGDFEAQITKAELPVLRPKSENPPPPWFWGSTKEPTTGFEAKPGETVASSFEAKLEKIVATGFEAKRAKTITVGFEANPLETVATDFEAKPTKTITTGFEAKPARTITAGFEVKPPKTVTTGFEVKSAKTGQVVLRPNHSQPITIDFDAQTDEKPSQWFWGQTIDKLSTLVLRLNQEIHAPRLHVHRADRTRRHPTYRSPSYWVPDPCDHPQSSAPSLLLLSWSSLLHAMPHLPPAHHETIKRDSLNETNIKEKQNKNVPDSNSNLTKSMTHHNQTKELTNWFLRIWSANSCFLILAFLRPTSPSSFFNLEPSAASPPPATVHCDGAQPLALSPLNEEQSQEAEAGARMAIAGVWRVDAVRHPLAQQHWAGRVNHLHLLCHD
jgi:hypothetical protein